MTLNITKCRSFSTVKRVYGFVDCHAAEVPTPLHCLGTVTIRSYVATVADHIDGQTRNNVNDIRLIVRTRTNPIFFISHVCKH